MIDELKSNPRTKPGAFFCQKTVLPSDNLSRASEQTMSPVQQKSHTITVSLSELKECSETGVEIQVTLNYTMKALTGQPFRAARFCFGDCLSATAPCGLSAYDTVTLKSFTISTFFLSLTITLIVNTPFVESVSFFCDIDANVLSPTKAFAPGFL